MSDTEDEESEDERPTFEGQRISKGKRRKRKRED